MGISKCCNIHCDKWCEGGEIECVFCRDMPVSYHGERDERGNRVHRVPNWA